MAQAKTQDIAIIIGAGERQGIGGAVAALIAQRGMHVFIAGRTEAKLQALAAAITAEGGKVSTVVTDSTQAADIERLFEQAMATGGELRFVLYNTGRNLPAAFMDSTERLVQGHWQRCVLGGLLVGQQAIRVMQQQADHGLGKGTIIYTGASASLRGKPLFSGFASAKAGLRAMVQSMAREFGPQGIHIGHIVIDGLVNGAVVRSVGPLGKFLLRQKGDDGALLPDQVAKSFLTLHQQQKTAWTHELDLRPYKESF
jgi:NAD(P)-dependent dehydrogenase (short-subunit alcohol dehydrogenase family)